MSRQAVLFGNSSPSSDSNARVCTQCCRPERSSLPGFARQDSAWDSSEGQVGLHRADGGTVYMLAAHPILTSDFDGDNRGAMYFGRILDAALDIFAHKGYYDTKLDEIASESKTSKGSIDFHFPNKERLFLSLVDQFSDVLERQVKDAIAQEATFSAIRASSSCFNRSRIWSYG